MLIPWSSVRPASCSAQSSAVPESPRPRVRPKGAEDVVEAAHRRRVASRVGGGLVDDVVQVREGLGIGVAHAREPAVRIPAGESQHPWFVGADPDLDRVGRGRAGVQSVDVMVLAVDADRGAVRSPDAADDLDALTERVDALRRGEPGAAGRHDRVPEPAGAQAEVHPATGDEVQGRDALGQDDRRAQRQVRDVERDPERCAARRDDGEQGPGVGVASLVRMVLDGDEVEATDLGDLGEQQHPVEVGGVRASGTARTAAPARSPRSHPKRRAAGVCLGRVE